MGFLLRDFGGMFIGGGPKRGADGKTRHEGGGYLSWFEPEAAREVSVTFIHGGGGQSTDFIRTPDGRQGWLHRFLEAGFRVNLLDRPGHGRAARGTGRQLAAPDYEMMSARFMHPARAALWPDAALHDKWPEGADDPFMASQGGMAPSLAEAQAQAEAIAPALFAQIGPSVLISHSAGSPCAWAMASHAQNSQIKAILALEPQGAPGMEHPLGRFEGLTVCPPKGPQDPFACPLAIMTAEASWMGQSNAEVVQFLAQKGYQVEHLKLAERGLKGNGHMLMSESNSDQVAALAIDWIIGTLGRQS